MRPGKWVVGLILAGLAACITLQVDTQPRFRGGEGLEPGDRVVARWHEGFWEATVLDVNQKLVTVAWDTPPPEQSYIARQWIVRRDAHPQLAAKGHWLLCQTGESWELCHVEFADADAINVIVIADGASRTFCRDEVLAIPGALEPWVAKNGARAIEQLALERKFAHAVPITAGQQISEGDIVIARWSDDNWWSGTVKAVHGNLVSIAWTDGSEDDDIPAVFVAPMPRQRAAFAPGDLAFCTYSGSSQWWPARIVRHHGAEVDVTFLDETRATLVASDCVPARQTP
ncbi:MAG: hypothetical protein JXR83_07360 [Deltaproteobacteria bacterium]|nr:hypothetical protein [Deltaproteobacteria bacterium]